MKAPLRNDVVKPLVGVFPNQKLIWSRIYHLGKLEARGYKGGEVINGYCQVLVQPEKKGQIRLKASSENLTGDEAVISVK